MARIYLASGNVIRIWLDTDGIKMMVVKSSMDNGDIVLIDDVEHGLGDMPKLPNH